MNKFKYFLLLPLCGLFFPVLSFADNYRVMRVVDGDTIVVANTYHNETFRIRLAEIDSPELGQTFGAESKSALSGLCRDGDFDFTEVDRDGYGRIVADVYCGGVLVNSELVRLGMAWVYPKYARTEALFDLQESAKARRVGLWFLDSPERPWEYRARKRNR